MGEAVQGLFCGGAVFGGKTSYLLGDFAQDLAQVENWRGVLFRQSYPDLEEIIDQSHEKYPYVGGEYLVGKHTWKFPWCIDAKRTGLFHCLSSLNFVYSMCGRFASSLRPTLNIHR